MTFDTHDFEIEEILFEEGELLVLSLGFASADDPLDILHIACGRTRSGAEPPLLEDLLYLERTDQDLACDGHAVRALIGHPDRVELVLTKEGAAALGLAARTRFRFTRQPSLAADALRLLAAMAAAGQSQVAVRKAVSPSAT